MFQVEFHEASLSVTAKLAVGRGQANVGGMDG